MAFSGMINVKTGLLTLGGQFEAYKRGQLERNIHTSPDNPDLAFLTTSQLPSVFFHIQRPEAKVLL